MSKPMVSIMTPTRDRPKAFHLAERWIGRQTFTDFEWIVVDDGDVPVKPTFDKVVHVRRDPSTVACTYPENMLEACNHVRGDYVIVVEDDDWFGPDFLKEMVENLENADVSTIASHCIYNVMSRTYDDGRKPKEENPEFSGKMAQIKSLTFYIGLRKMHLHAIKKFCGIAIAQWRMGKVPETTYKAQGVYRRFWKDYVLPLHDRNEIVIKLYNTDQLIFIKGISGRFISGAHFIPKKSGVEVDPEGEILARAVGSREDAESLLAAAMPIDIGRKILHRWKCGKHSHETVSEIIDELR